MFRTRHPPRESPMTTISEARTEVQREMQALVALVDQPSPLTATEAEIALWSGVLRLGVSLMTLFFAHQAARWPRGHRYLVDGVPHEVEGADLVEIGTKFGKAGVLQPIGRRVGRPRARRDSPMARALGLPGGFTLPLVALVAKFCALMAFAPTRQILRDLLGWAPAPRSVLRMVDTVGAEVRGFLDQAVVPEGDTDVLLITVDGKGAPAISSAEHKKRRQPHRKGTGGLRQRKSGAPKKRRGPGKKSKNAKMAAVGVICTLKVDAKGHMRPVNKRMYATFTTYRALFEWLKKEAARRGYGTSKFKKVQFVADGADTLWSLQQEFFPDAEVCLDWIHAVEKLWGCGKAINRGSRTKRAPLEAWVYAQKKLLRHGKLNEVLATLQTALDGTAVRRTERACATRGFANKVSSSAVASSRARCAISSGCVSTVQECDGARPERRRSFTFGVSCSTVYGRTSSRTSRAAIGDPLRLVARPVPTVTRDAKKQVKMAA
ncbi:MAG: hypothetical protein ABJE95_04165 [Byssovorax sp.]